MHAKINHFHCTEGHEKEFREHEKLVFHIALEFSEWDEPFVRKLSESGEILGRDADNRRVALAWDGDKVDFACASGGEGPVLQ